MYELQKEHIGHELSRESYYCTLQFCTSIDSLKGLLFYFIPAYFIREAVCIMISSNNVRKIKFKIGAFYRIMFW